MVNRQVLVNNSQSILIQLDDHPVVDSEHVQPNYMNEFQMIMFQIIMYDHLEPMLRQANDWKMLPRELKLKINKLSKQEITNTLSIWSPC